MFEAGCRIWPQSPAISPTMRSLIVIFILALVAIAGEIYADTVMTSAGVSPTAGPDPASVAIAHGLRHG
jgi:hypothetical protein